MNDTSPEMEKQYYAQLMQLSGEERLKMGCAMFAAAKEIVRSSILNESPGLTERELKEKFFLRFYGLEFSQEQRQRIIAGLRG